jgi:DNA-directed RNA polymerase subunit L
VDCHDFTVLTNFLFLEAQGTVRFLNILISPAFFKVGIAPLILAGMACMHAYLREKMFLEKVNLANYSIMHLELMGLAHFRIVTKGLEELQRKLQRLPKEIERIRKELLAKYGRKIEQEAKEACPTEKLKESVKVEFLPNGNFNVKHSSEAKQYVEPVIKRNKVEMRSEIERRIGEAWQT